MGTRSNNGGGQLPRTNGVKILTCKLMKTPRRGNRGRVETPLVVNAAARCESRTKLMSISRSGSSPATGEELGVERGHDSRATSPVRRPTGGGGRGMNQEVNPWSAPRSAVAVSVAGPFVRGEREGAILNHVFKVFSA
ncbi:hypothetical protein ZWY2020_010593 [Hordeum vulgare]|nr:hypothetical protein ZWY2020_010593 [Hordeum vulgare]